MTEKRPAPTLITNRFPTTRASERIASVMRTAKIHCIEGEYICIVRNLSCTGAGLRFFHAAPRDGTIELEMANGFRQTMHCVWQDGDQAGYRFANPVVVSQLLDDPGNNGRQEIRIKLDVPAAVSADGKVSRLRLLDLSQTGAQIEGEVPLPVHQTIRLAINGMLPRLGHVCWRKGLRHGLVFQQGLDLVELACLAHQMSAKPIPASIEAAPHRLSLARCA